MQLLYYLTVVPVEGTEVLRSKFILTLFQVTALNEDLGKIPNRDLIKNKKTFDKELLEMDIFALKVKFNFVISSKEELVEDGIEVKDSAAMLVSGKMIIKRVLYPLWGRSRMTSCLRGGSKIPRNSVTQVFISKFRRIA